MKCPICNRDGLDVDLTEQSEVWKIYCKHCGAQFINLYFIPVIGQATLDDIFKKPYQRVLRLKGVEK